MARSTAHPRRPKGFCSRSHSSGTPRSPAGGNRRRIVEGAMWRLRGQASFLSDLGVFCERLLLRLNVTENELAKQIGDAGYRIHTSPDPGELGRRYFKESSSSTPTDPPLHRGSTPPALGLFPPAAIDLVSSFLTINANALFLCKQRGVRLNTSNYYLSRPPLSRRHAHYRRHRGRG